MLIVSGILAVLLFARMWFIGGSVGPIVAHAGSDQVQFGNRPPLPSAAKCAESKELNPRLSRLNESQLEALDRFIQAVNERIANLTDQKRRLAHDWAGLRIANGDYSFLGEEGRLRLARGRIGIAVAEPGEPTKFVVIGPGEYAPLDLVEAELHGVAEQARTAVMRYFASHGNQASLALPGGG